MDDKKSNRSLSDRPKRDPFVAPDGYFDNLHAKIDRRLEGFSVRPKTIHVNWWSIGYAAAAAIALLIAVLVVVNIPSKKPQSAAEMIAGLTPEECLAYLSSTGIEIDEIIGSIELPLLPEELLPEVDAYENFTEEDLDMLYERFGVTPEKNLQSL